MHACPQLLQSYTVIEARVGYKLKRLIYIVCTYVIPVLYVVIPVLYVVIPVLYVVNGIGQSTSDEKDYTTIIKYSKQLRSQYSHILQHGQGVGLRVEHPLVQGDNPVITEQQVEVLEGLGQKEALLGVVVLGWHSVHIPDSSVTIVRSAMFVDCLKWMSWNG